MKPTPLFLIFLFITMAGCGYTPVRKPFVINNDSYRAGTIINDRLRILSWNIHKMVGDEHWQNDFITIVRDTKKPDIILLQEVRFESDMSRILRDDLTMGWEFTPNLYQKKYKAWSGVLTASRIKPTLVKPFLSTVVEPFVKTPKPVLFTKYSLGPDSLELLVVNIHGINFKFTLADFKEQLKRVALFVSGHDGPVIMGGDFNTWSTGRIECLEKHASEMGLAAVSFGSESDTIESVFGNALDHIYISTDTLKVVEGSQDVIEAVNSSDHKPLFVELRIEL